MTAKMITEIMTIKFILWWIVMMVMEMTKNLLFVKAMAGVKAKGAGAALLPKGFPAAGHVCAASIRSGSRSTFTCFCPE